MDVEIFAEWLRRQGHQVVRSESSYWYDAGPRVLQAFPYHWLIQPSKQELRELTLGRGFLALRYSMPFGVQSGLVSYHVVLNGPYDMELLRSQARNGIRRGLENCQVEIISLERLATEGWELQQDTLDRQGRLNSMSKSEWQGICLSAEGLPGFEAWAAIVDGNLAATILTARIGDTCYVPYAQSHCKYLGLHVNNALFYVASRAMLSREGVKGIFFSLHSLDAPESVNEFKFRMGLKAKPVRQKIVFHPAVRPFVNRLSYKMLRNWMLRDSENHIVAKAEGMLRFYLQGQLPSTKQRWPDCLSDYRESFA
jgi:hypothetical protein